MVLHQLLLVMAVQVQHLQLQARQLLEQVVVAVAVLVQALRLAQVVLAVVVLVRLQRVLYRLLELLIQVVAVVEHHINIMAVVLMAVQVLSFFLFQQQNTQAQPQAHQQSQQAAQIQF
jgi:hypothetical protein